MTDKVAIIIPFYQEQPGILRRAIESVCAQTGVSDIEVIVIDDGSFVNANQDLIDLSTPSHIQINILKQENSGPAAARNNGLNNISVDTEYVAFLDSDDEWSRDHLSRALAAFGKGYDFYFANFFEIEQKITAFERLDRIDLGIHHPVSGLENIYEYCGNLQEQEIVRPIVYTPTVAYRLSKFPMCRFPEKLLYAREDQLYWLELITHKPKIAFSMAPECYGGLGANLFHGTKWGTDRALKMLYCDIIYRKEILRKYAPNDKLRLFTKGKLRESRRGFASSILHILRRKIKIDTKFLFRSFISDPMTFVYICFVAIHATLRKI